MRYDHSPSPSMSEVSSAPLVLSKYERVQIVASRVEQLLAGAPRLVDDIDTDDVTKIAEEEIARRVLPIRVARSLPNNKVRIHDLRDFIDPASPALMPTNLAKDATPKALEDGKDVKAIEEGKDGKDGKDGESRA